jgi:hypothetical protein
MNPRIGDGSDRLPRLANAMPFSDLCIVGSRARRRALAGTIRDEARSDMQL